MERTAAFADSILEFTSSLPDTKEGRIVSRQLAKSGTSIGANVSEVEGCNTRDQKRHCFVIACREGHETLFWLNRVMNQWPDTEKVQSYHNECDEIVSILHTIINNL